MRAGQRGLAEQPGPAERDRHGADAEYDLLLPRLRPGHQRHQPQSAATHSASRRWPAPTTPSTASGAASARATASSRARGRRHRRGRQRLRRRRRQQPHPEVQLARALHHQVGHSRHRATASSTSPGIATDAAGNVYVADTRNNRIQKFSATGTFITKWGSSGSGNGQFDAPSRRRHRRRRQRLRRRPRQQPDPEVQLHGRLHHQVGHLRRRQRPVHQPAAWPQTRPATSTSPTPGNSRIQKFNSTGTFITKWGSYGHGQRPVRQPLRRGHRLRRQRLRRRPEQPHPEVHRQALITKWGDLARATASSGPLASRPTTWQRLRRRRQRPHPEFKPPDARSERPPDRRYYSHLIRTGPSTHSASAPAGQLVELVELKRLKAPDSRNSRASFAAIASHRAATTKPG